MEVCSLAQGLEQQKDNVLTNVPTEKTVTVDLGHLTHPFPHQVAAGVPPVTLSDAGSLMTPILQRSHNKEPLHTGDLWPSTQQDREAKLLPALYPSAQRATLSPLLSEAS